MSFLLASALNFGLPREENWVSLPKIGSKPLRLTSLWAEEKQGIKNSQNKKFAPLGTALGFHKFSCNKVDQMWGVRKYVSDEHDNIR